MISYPEMLARIVAECPPSRRQELEKILKRRPFEVVDLAAAGVRADNGETARGAYDADTDRLFIDAGLSPRESALALYLHEAVHAGVFSAGMRMLQHDARFNRLVDEAFGYFGLVQSAKGRNYNTRDTPERIQARAPGLLALAAVAGIPLALYAKFAGWVGMTGFFIILGAAVIAVFAEKIRQARA